jgi:hypothetical protein
MTTDNTSLFSDEQLQNAWCEWEQHRKEKKQKLTPLSVKKQLKFLDGRSKEEIIGIIDQSIQNGWTGLFELKNNGKATNKHQQHASSLVKNFAETYGAIFTGRPDGQGNGPAPLKN